jgi:hypothetical protein
MSKQKITLGSLPRQEKEGVRVPGILTKDIEQAIAGAKAPIPHLLDNEKYRSAAPDTQKIMRACARKRRARALRYIFNPEEEESGI